MSLGYDATCTEMRRVSVYCLQLSCAGCRLLHYLSTTLPYNLLPV